MNEFAREKIVLKNFLVKRFNIDEMKSLMFDLGLDDDFLESSRERFAVELISKCLRLGVLYCLVSLVVTKRLNDNLEIKQLLENLTPVECYQKVEIISKEEFYKDPQGILNKIAQMFESGGREVQLLGVAASSLRLLVGISGGIAKLQKAIINRTLYPRDLHITLIRLFDSLDRDSQNVWRFVVSNSKPIVVNNNLFPTISWDDAVKKSNAISKSEHSVSQQLGDESFVGYSSSEEIPKTNQFVPPPLFPQQRISQQPDPLPAHINSDPNLAWYRVSFERPDSVFADIKKSGWLLVHKREDKQEVKKNALVVVQSDKLEKVASISLKPLTQEETGFPRIYLARKEKEGPFSKTGNKVTLSSEAKQVPIDLEHILGYVVGLWLEMGESEILEN